MEDAHALDPFLRVIRACLQHCSIPLVVMMTHRRDDAALAAMDSEGKPRHERLANALVAAKALVLSRRREPPRAREVEGPISSDDSHPGLSLRRFEFGRDDVWGLKVGGRSPFMLSSRARPARRAPSPRRDNFPRMLEQYATTVVDVAALSRGDLRELVEVFAAERLIPRGGASVGRRRHLRPGKLGSVSSGAGGVFGIRPLVDIGRRQESPPASLGP